jgi:DNA-binding helix-hairpin-helix protein with protein kinase domain
MTTKLKTPLQLPLELAVEPAAPAHFINAESVETFPPGIYNSQRQSLMLGDKIGGGGEGTVYDIQGHADLVAKIYHAAPSPEKADKLIALSKLSNEHLCKMAAWPVDVLRDRPNGNVIGFVMKKIGQAAEVHTLHSPKSRLKKFPEASWAFLLHVATNIVRAVATMHEHGFVIGDVNPKNILVTRQATVHMLDCDSLQFAADGKTYRCEGGFPEYTPPELQGIPFADVNRTQEHDCFALAVVIFQLLFLGRHPYSGRFLGAGEMPLEQAIRESRFAYGTDAATRHMQPPPGTLPLDALPAELVALFRRAFLAADRPNPTEWLAPLEQLSKRLQRCKLHNGHFYWGQLKDCPWCYIETRAGVRLFHLHLAGRAQTRELLQLDELWTEIKDLEQIKKLPHTPNLPAQQLSAAALQFAQASAMRFWLANAFAALTGGFIAWVTDFPVAIWFLVIAGNFARLLAKTEYEVPAKVRGILPNWLNLSHEPILKNLRLAKNLAETQLRRLEQQFWGTKDGENNYAALLKNLKTLVRAYETLDQRRAQKLQRAGAKARAAALMQYLQRCSIADSKLVSASMAHWMRTKGIVSAADVSEKTLRQKGVVNEYHLQKLLDWRQQLEAQFTFDATRHVTSADRVAIEQELNVQQQRLEDELMTTLQQVRTHKLQLDTRHQQLLPPWREAKQALAQAELDLEEVAKPKRLAPIFATLVVVFLLVSILENAFRIAPSPPPKARTVSSGTSGSTVVPIGSEFDRLVMEGESQMRGRNYQAAYEKYSAALNEVVTSQWELKHTQAYYQLAYAQEMLGQAQDTIRSLESQLLQSPLRKKDRLHLIVLYWIKSKDTLARQHYQQLKKADSRMAASVRELLKFYNFELDLLSP